MTGANSGVRHGLDILSGLIVASITAAMVTSLGGEGMRLFPLLWICAGVMGAIFGVPTYLVGLPSGLPD